MSVSLSEEMNLAINSFNELINVESKGDETDLANDNVGNAVKQMNLAFVKVGREIIPCVDDFLNEVEYNAKRDDNSRAVLEAITADLLMLKDIMPILCEIFNKSRSRNAVPFLEATDSTTNIIELNTEAEEAEERPIISENVPND